MPRARRRDLLGKRLLGYVNWHRGRKLVHRREILDALTKDMLDRHPDQIAVTGDLVNLGLPEEFRRAAEWLKSLSGPPHVTAIPGNHDAYVRLHPDRGTGLWQPYMQSNEAGEILVPTPPQGFPFVRRFGDIALVALSSAIPTMPFLAAGRLGSTQRKFLGVALERLRQKDLFRVVLIHHPPLPGQAPWRRALRDAGKLKTILQTHGAELVLHGHDHEATLKTLDTATGTAFVVGVPSASEMVEGEEPAAGYAEYGIARVEDGWYCEMTRRAPMRMPDPIWQDHTQVLRHR